MATINSFSLPSTATVPNYGLMQPQATPTTQPQQPGSTATPATTSTAVTPAASAGATNSGNYPIQPATPATSTAQAATPATPAQSATLAPPGPIAENATVEGRLNNLLKTDSPYMQQARDYANQSMNRRGLMQSSIAVGAAQEAAIKSALPIAQQDASQQYGTDNTYQLHQYDMAKADKNSGIDYQKQYLALGAAANDRYAQEFARIQESQMTADQKAAAVIELKGWKTANDAWLNTKFTAISGLDLSAFGASAPATDATAGTQQQAPDYYSAPTPLLQQTPEQQKATIKTWGTTQQTIDYATSKGWPLVYNGQYLSGLNPITFQSKTWYEPIYKAPVA